MSDDAVGGTFYTCWGNVLHLLGEHKGASPGSCLMSWLGERFTPVGGTLTRVVIDVCVMTFLRDLAR